MFRKPPSKLEQLQDSVVHALDNLRDAVADLPADRVAHSTNDKLKAVAQTQRQLGETVSEKTEVLRARAGDATHTAAAVAARGAQTVAHTAQNATGALSGAATTVAGAVTGAVGGIGGAASNIAHSVGERLHLIHQEPSKAEIAAQHAHNVREAAAQHAHEWSEAAQNAAASVAAIAAERAARAKNIVVRRKVEVPAPVEVQYEETSSRWIWISVGILAGAALALLLAPTTGRRSRALISDKLSDAKKGAGALGGAAAGKIGDIKRRTEGAIHNRFPGGEDDADDNTIADRVRTTLGEAPATRNLERLNVDCVDGLVTLRGPLADAALQAEIEAVVRGVKGVREVKLDLLTDESENDAPTFVG
ncbi:MAG TPA: BON domain-containing protein [Abditibacteriaceae bacterium]|jgi:gas vesicle protein